MLYKLKVDYVTAVRWTGYNLTQVLNVFKHLHLDYQLTIHLEGLTINLNDTKGRKIYIPNGYWIVFSEGKMKVLDNEQFNMTYERADK